MLYPNLTPAERRGTRHSSRDRGFVSVALLVIGLALMGMTVVSLQMTLADVQAQRTQRFAFRAAEAAESGLAQGIAYLKDGLAIPASGGVTGPHWIPFGTSSPSAADFLFYVEENGAASIVRAWGRVAVGETPSTAAVPPDNVSWNGTDWLVKGIEATLLRTPFVPPGPMFFGNGGMQRPMGGFEWDGGSDPFDPSSWGVVTSNPESTQLGSVPLEVSALDHPFDFLYNGGTPAAAETPHPFSILATQNPIGQRNAEAWFANSAGPGNDPTVNVSPPPGGTSYDPDRTSPNELRIPYRQRSPGRPDARLDSLERFQRRTGDDPSQRRVPQWDVRRLSRREADHCDG